MSQLQSGGKTARSVVGPYGVGCPEPATEPLVLEQDLRDPGGSLCLGEEWFLLPHELVSS